MLKEVVVESFEQIKIISRIISHYLISFLRRLIRLVIEGIVYRSLNLENKLRKFQE